MSSRTCAETVPFAVRRVWSGDVLDDDFEDVPKIVARIIYTREDQSGFCFHGWTMQVEAIDWGQHLIVGFLRKGDLWVYELNEAEDAAGGGLSQTFFANSREALEEFIRDCCGDVPDLAIETQVAVQQTL